MSKVPAFLIQDFSLAFIFFRTFGAIVSPLNLETSYQPMFSNVFQKFPVKDILTSFKPSIFKIRMEIFCLFHLLKKKIDSLLSMNHWHKDESSLFKTFWISFKIIMLVENASAFCIQIGLNFLWGYDTMTLLLTVVHASVFNTPHQTFFRSNQRVKLSFVSFVFSTTKCFWQIAIWFTFFRL